MGIGVFVHHIGTLLLLVATALLVVTSISAPVVNQISILHVDLGNNNAGSDLNFGTFGWCVRHANGRDGDDCSGSHIGYNPAQEIHKIDGSDFGDATENTTKGLTRVMVLHPVGAALCFIAFLLCLGTGIVGSFIASLISALAFLVTAVALICDFVSFSLLKHDINKSGNNNDSKAEFGVAIWTVLAAGVCALLATILVFVTCCAGRVRDKRHVRKSKGWTDDVPAGRGAF